MTQDNRLSAFDLARELNMGPATIKFLLKRFKAHFPFELINGQERYPASTVHMLLEIQDLFETGLLPSEIEEKINSKNHKKDPSPESSLKDMMQNSDIRLSHDGLDMLKSLFKDIGQQQERIAAAHEKRAEVEERKALAIEKRAQAEENKAQAMNNIAAALQEMNKLRANDAASQQIAHQTGTVIITDEADEPVETDNLSDLISDIDTADDTDLDLSSLLDEEDLPKEAFEPKQSNRQQDRLTSDPLTDETDPEFDPELEDSLDDPLQDFDEDLLEEDLSSLGENDNIPASDETVQPKVDDLSLLLDDADRKDSRVSEQMDDLSLLIEEETKEVKEDTDALLDDLSLLLDAPADARPADQKTEEKVDFENELDDLSALIDEKPEETEAPAELDDLSLLIEEETKEVIENTDVPLDDLSKLIDTPSEAPPITIDIRPEDDLGKYKAAVTKIIIELKASGLTVEETTSRLNQNKIKTLSGKSQWAEKAIMQIYKFIDSAK